MGNYESAGGHVSLSMSFDPIITDRDEAYREAAAWCESIAVAEMNILKSNR